MARAGYENDAALGKVKGIDVSNQAIQKWRTDERTPEKLRTFEHLVTALNLDRAEKDEFRDAYMRARDPDVAKHFERQIRELRARYEEQLKDEQLGALSVAERGLIWNLRWVQRDEPHVSFGVLRFVEAAFMSPGAERVSPDAPGLAIMRILSLLRVGSDTRATELVECFANFARFLGPAAASDPSTMLNDPLVRTDLAGEIGWNDPRGDEQ